MSYDADGNWIDDEVPDASDGQQTLNGVIPWPTTGEVPPAPTTPTDQYRGGELEDLGNGTGIDPRNGAIIDLRPGSPTKGQRIDSRPDIAATINEGRARQALARQTQDNADRTRADQLTKDANDLAQRNLAHTTLSEDQKSINAVRMAELQAKIDENIATMVAAGPGKLTGLMSLLGFQPAQITSMLQNSPYVQQQYQRLGLPAPTLATVTAQIAGSGGTAAGGASGTAAVNTMLGGLGLAPVTANSAPRASVAPAPATVAMAGAGPAGRPVGSSFGNNDTAVENYQAAYAQWFAGLSPADQAAENSILAQNYQNSLNHQAQTSAPGSPGNLQGIQQGRVQPGFNPLAPVASGAVSSIVPPAPGGAGPAAAALQFVGGNQWSGRTGDMRDAYAARDANSSDYQLAKGLATFAGNSDFEQQLDQSRPKGVVAAPTQYR